MKASEIIRVIEQFSPTELQESYDNSGLLIGSPDTVIQAVLCTIDITEEVVAEALSIGANMIISHHPIVFAGLKKITGKNYVERVVRDAIRNDIVLYAAHTNADNIRSGVNAEIATRIGLTKTRILDPVKDALVKLVTFVPEAHVAEVRSAIFEAGAGHIGNYDCCSYSSQGKGSFRAGAGTSPFTGKPGELHFEEEIRLETILPKFLLRSTLKAMIAAHPYEEVAYDVYPLANTYPVVGAGMIGELANPVEVGAFLDLLKETFSVPVVRYSGQSGKPVQKVAVCGGAGSFLLGKAIASGADAFVTGDVKYHQFFDAEDHILFCDIGHFESEQFTKEIFYSLLTKKFSNFAVHLSKVVTNPVKYHL